MSNRYYNQFLHSFRKKLTFIEGSFVVGTTGDVGATTGAGVTSVTRTGTGAYRITLQDKYNRFLGAGFSFDEAAVGSVGVSEVNHKLPQTGIPAGYLDVQMRNASGTAANATAGSTFYFNILVDNTSVLPSSES